METIVYLVYTKTMDNVEGARWLARKTPNILRFLPPSNLEKMTSKLICCGVYHLTVLVYTKTAIHLSVGGKRWILASHLHFGELLLNIPQFPKLRTLRKIFEG